MPCLLQPRSEQGQQGDFKAAVLDFNKAIVIDPNYANAYNNRGIVYAIREI